jgi:transcriptional regulator with XRE-family HTH domain
MLSQSAFAGLMGVSLRTVQDWEQGGRKPSGPAIELLRIAEQKPEVFTQLSWVQANASGIRHPRQATTVAARFDARGSPIRNDHRFVT